MHNISKLVGRPMSPKVATKLKTKTPTQQMVVVLLMFFAGAIGISVAMLMISGDITLTASTPCDSVSVKCVYGPKDSYTTINDAVNDALPGDTVLIYPNPHGIYTLPSGNTGSIRITTPNLTVKGIDRDSVVIDGLNLPYLDHTNGNVFFVNGESAEDANDVTISDLTIIRAGRAGIRVSLADDVTISNTRIFSSAKWGIVTDFAENILIEKNYIDTTTDPTAQHDIYVANSADHPIIRGNTLINAHKAGLQINGDCQANPQPAYGGVQDGEISYAIIENNKVFSNDEKGFSIISAPHALIQNNLIYDNGEDNIGHGIHLTDQIAQDGKPTCNKPSNDAIIVNNTIVEPRRNGITITDAATRATIFNNIVLTLNTAKDPILDNVGGNFIDASSNILSHSANNLFVSYTNDNNSWNDDLHLLKTSTATNTHGTTLYNNQTAPVIDLDQFNRNAPFDIGAFEYKNSNRTKLQFTQ